MGWCAAEAGDTAEFQCFIVFLEQDCTAAPIQRLLLLQEPLSMCREPCPEVGGSSELSERTMNPEHLLHAWNPWGPQEVAYVFKALHNCKKENLQQTSEWQKAILPSSLLLFS